MNYLENWADTSKISTNGWTKKFSYSLDDKCVVFTATNGWVTFAWNSPFITDKELWFEFDYRFTNTENWNSCFVTDSNSYAGNTVINLKEETNWTHFRQKITFKTQYAGINVRGNDSTGKSVVMQVKNVRLYPNGTTKNQFCKNGNCNTDELIEAAGFSIYPTSIYTDNFIEN